MKSKRITLYTWQHEGDDIQPDWPKIQSELGNDRVIWLLAQDHSHCQLVVDRQGDQHSLVAEFYHSVTLNNYLMMWPSSAD